eukprot:389902_1
MENKAAALLSSFGIEQPKKPHKACTETIEQKSTETIVDSAFIDRFDNEQCNDMMQQCLEKIFPIDPIRIIQEFSSPWPDPPFQQLSLFTDFTDEFDFFYDQFNAKNRASQIRMPQILKEMDDYIGDIVQIAGLKQNLFYIIDNEGKLTDITSNNLFTIPSAISENFHNPILYYSSFNTCSFEIDLTFNSEVTKNFISTYLSTFNIDQKLISKLNEIEIPYNMKCTLVFPQKDDKKKFPLHPFLQFDYAALIPRYKTVKICRKFYLDKAVKNIQNQIICWLKLFDFQQICFTKCKWQTWNKEEQYINEQILQNELSEYGYWIEQSNGRHDVSFFVKGNKTNIKHIKRILTKHQKKGIFIICAQLIATKYFEECNDTIQSLVQNKRRLIFEPKDDDTNENGIDVSTFGMGKTWQTYLTQYCDNCCITLLEGPLDKIHIARSIIYNSNGDNIVCSAKEIGSILEFDSTSLS